MRRAKKSPWLSHSDASGFFLLGNGTHAGKQRVTVGGRPAPRCFAAQLSGLQIRAGGEDVAGSRPLGSGQISPDAGAGLTSDSSAVAKADLSLRRAAPTPNYPSQCPGEEKVVF